ncbi:MAG: hypothetical protein IKI64_02055 [Clostridia bacterium]|nr:hypothetical protein [Clostridia bacterium]
MKIIGSIAYNDDAVPSQLSFRAAQPARPVFTAPFRSAYRAPGAKGLGELTYSSYSRLHSRVLRGIALNVALSLLLIAALSAVMFAAIGADQYDGGIDFLIVGLTPILCIAAIVYIAIGVYTDAKADLALLRREKKRLSRSAQARIERKSGRRRLSMLITLAASAALLIVLNAFILA